MRDFRIGQESGGILHLHVFFRCESCSRHGSISEDQIQWTQWAWGCLWIAPTGS